MKGFRRLSIVNLLKCCERLDSSAAPPEGGSCGLARRSMTILPMRRQNGNENGNPIPGRIVRLNCAIQPAFAGSRKRHELLRHKGFSHFSPFARNTRSRAETGACARHSYRWFRCPPTLPGRSARTEIARRARTVGRRLRRLAFTSRLKRPVRLLWVQSGNSRWQQAIRRVPAGLWRPVGSKRPRRQCQKCDNLKICGQRRGGHHL